MDRKEKNENISLWILGEIHQKDRKRAKKEEALKSQSRGEKPQKQCFKCKKSFDEPKLIQYYACPHCLSRIPEETKAGCQYWFGFLSQKDKAESIPQECLECEKVLECMLNQYYGSSQAVSEIKKWY